MKRTIQAIKIQCRILASTGVLPNAGVVFCATLYAFVHMSIVHFSVTKTAECGTAAFLKDCKCFYCNFSFCVHSSSIGGFVQT